MGSFGVGEERESRKVGDSKASLCKVASKPPLSEAFRSQMGHEGEEQKDREEGTYANVRKRNSFRTNKRN